MIEQENNNLEQEKQEKSEKPEIIIENTNSAISWVERTLSMLDKYPFYKIIKALFIIIIISYVLYLAFNPTQTYDMWKNLEEEHHSELIEERITNSPKIQEKCENLMKNTGAHRCLFFEFHNNTGNIVGMPFYYASASCEALVDNIPPAAQSFAEIKLSLYPFSNYLFENGYWCGLVENMKPIDKSLYYQMMAYNCKYASFYIVDGTDRPCGFIYLGFEGEEMSTGLYNEQKVEMEMRRTAVQLAVLVEASKNE